MNRFNLTFSGEILAGEDPEQVRLRFADMFGIDDRVRLERFFSGETIILRRNLERKDAAELYQQLQLMGAVGALVKVTTSEMADDVVNTTSPAKGAQFAGAPANGAAPPSPAAGQKLHSTDAAAEIKARKLAAQRLAAEKAAKVKAEEEERQRRAAEEAVQQAEKNAELKRLEEEEAARKKALKLQAKRKAAEEAAQRKAKRAREKAEKAQRKAEAAAQKKAEAEEKKRLAAEEEARRKAELAEQKRLAQEAEARRKAELAEQKRLAEEAEVLRKAKLAEEKRLAEEAEARRKAKLAEETRLAEEAEARRKAELELKKRQAAEKKARQKAALEKRKRLAAEKEARRLAELEKAKRVAAEEEARKTAAEARQAAALQAELEEKARLAAAQAAKVKAEELLNTVKPGGRPRANKPGKSRVKTSLDVPLRQTGETPEIGTPGKRKRQSGAPNLYKLRPFRNSQTVKTRGTLAQARMRQAYAFGGFALAILLILAGSFLQIGENPVITGASAVAINPNSEPVLLAGDSLLFHDRAGVSNTTVALHSLGVESLQAPMVYTDAGALVALGRLSAEKADFSMPIPLRCDLALASCTPFSAQLNNSTIDTFAINTLEGSVLLADTMHQKLLKTDSTGTIIASAAIDLPPTPVLQLHGGLLLMNSAAGPAISVYRYENSAFAEQLDEILLLPPSELPLESSRVSDFIWSGDAWWVILRDSVSGSAELHRFDSDWSYLDTVPLTSRSGPLQLISWGQKTLVNDPRDPAIQRFNAQGAVEAPFVSTQLQALVDTQQQRARLVSLAWNSVLLMCALAAALCFSLGYLHGLRTLVYRPHREQGAEPLDDHAKALHWIEPVQNRHLQLRRTGMFYGLGVIAAVLLAVALSVGVWQLAALLLALSGPAIALLLLSRQPVGHIGVLGDKVLLVDHSGQYHLGGGPRLNYRGPFLVIDDIVVFTGSRLLPAFSPAPLQQHISPPAMGGIKVDNKTIAIKLLECRHPLALGGIAIVAAAAVGALILLSQGLF
ncbi:Uncharacterised protein [Halioglobus japonicus]|nr:Uncharacterised protein [Halioglobus japonicus]